MKCPGQDTRYWKPGDIFEVECPACRKQVEFFKDEATRKCRVCGKTLVNPRMDFGCAAYCKYAADCLGELGPEMLAKRKDLLKDRIAVEVKRLMGRDFQAIAHAVRVARFVEEIAREEKTEPALVLCAAYLHLFDEREPDGPDEGGKHDARRVLEGLGVGQELVEDVVAILDGLRRSDPGDSPVGKVLADAHRLALLEEQKASWTGGKKGDWTKALFTRSGEDIASRLEGQGREEALCFKDEVKESIR
jgi:hypothetical protein